jgi:hypothetical protein
MRREQYPYYYACGLVAGWYAPQAASARTLPEEDPPAYERVYDEIEASRNRMEGRRRNTKLAPQGRPRA